MIQKVEWTRVDNNGVDQVFQTDTVTTTSGRKAANGFTNFEYFDFSDPNNGHFIIQNPTDNGVQLEYLLSDFEVFTNLPASNLLGDPFTNTTGGMLVFSNSTLSIAPGQTIDIQLGAVSADTYSLARIGTLTVTDLVSGSIDLYSTDQGYYQTNKIPEPSSIALVGVGAIILLVCFAACGNGVWRRGGGRRETRVE